MNFLSITIAVKHFSSLPTEGLTRSLRREYTLYNGRNNRRIPGVKSTGTTLFFQKAITDILTYAREKTFFPPQYFCASPNGKLICGAVSLPGKQPLCFIDIPYRICILFTNYCVELKKRKPCFMHASIKLNYTTIARGSPGCLRGASGCASTVMYRRRRRRSAKCMRDAACRRY